MHRMLHIRKRHQKLWADLDEIEKKNVQKEC